MKVYRKLGFTHLETAEIVTSINKLLSNYHVHYQKLRKFHWEVEGSDFFDLHNLFEEEYNQVQTNIDDLAERIRVFGKMPLGTLHEGDLITIKADLNYYKIPVSNIIFIETSGGYLTLHTKADTYTFYGNIQDFHNKLASRDFMQCHRSYVVNMSYIASFKDSTLFMEDDHEVPVSRKHRKAIIDFF